MGSNIPIIIPTDVISSDEEEEEDDENYEVENEDSHGSLWSYTMLLYYIQELYSLCWLLI